MRRTATMVLTVAAFVVALSGTALATSEPLPLFTGTAAGDALKGTPGADVLYGKGGDDLLQGLGGDDILYGDAGADSLYGGPGTDTFISVGDSAGDLVDCGDGIDTVKMGADQGLDRFANCERFVR